VTRLAPTSAAATATGRCAVCGEPEPLGDVVCRRCADDTLAPADTLVVVQGDERAYVRVPNSLAPAVVDRLAGEGCRARAVAVRQAWMAVPAHTWTLVVAVLVSGFWAAHVIDPKLWATTTILAAALLVAADQSMRRPRLSPAVTDGAAELPPRLRRVVSTILDELPPGDARRALADVVRRARPLISALQKRPDDRRVLGDVSDLVGASCEIAAELDRVDSFLAHRADPQSAAALRIRSQGVRETLVRRLADAGAAIDALYAQLLQEGSPASARVAELASELSAEATARREASKELEEFLKER
jgi:hypothetical protein